MKRFVIMLSLVVGAWAFSPTLDFESSSWSTSTAQAKKQRNGWKGKNDKAGKRLGKRVANTDKRGVPELDPSSAAAAIVLLLGGMAYVASRRREDSLA